MIYKDKELVSAVMTVISECVAGIYWVGILEKIRGQGLGSFATQIATNTGFDSGKNPSSYKHLNLEKASIPD